jgi:hypothetical protein
MNSEVSPSSAEIRRIAGFVAELLSAESLVAAGRTISEYTDLLNDVVLGLLSELKRHTNRLGEQGLAASIENYERLLRRSRDVGLGGAIRELGLGEDEAVVPKLLEDAAAFSLESSNTEELDNLPRSEDVTSSTPMF